MNKSTLVIGLLLTAAALYGVMNLSKSGSSLRREDDSNNRIFFKF